MADVPSFASLEGERVGREHGQMTLPVDPREIARRVNIEIEAKEISGGVSGMLIRVGEAFTIAYATHFQNEGFERFSIGHELGHYFLPGHPENVFDANGIHRSRAGFISKDAREQEADHFAVGLLMPRRAFSRASDHAGDGLDAIEALSKQCRTSLTATAIRVTECTDTAVAILVSNQERVEFCFMSSTFKAIPDLTWIRKDDSIPRCSVTWQLVADPHNIVDHERMEDVVNIQEWFGGGPNLKLTEQVRGLGRYGKVLTVLTPEEPFDEQEDEEDRALLASWTPAFRKS